VDLNFFSYLFARRWPVLLVVLAGLIFAVVYWRRHPKVSVLTISGLLIFQIQALAFSTIYYFLPRLAQSGWTWNSIDNLSIVIDIVHDICFAAGLGLLAAAVLAGRKRPTAISQPHPFDPSSSPLSGQ
jgi:hypothetical protein